MNATVISSITASSPPYHLSVTSAESCTLQSLQVELNPTWQQKKLIEFCKDKSIQVSAYSPLGGQRIPKMNPVRQSDVQEEIGKARGKSVAQVWTVFSRCILIVLLQFN